MLNVDRRLVMRLCSLLKDPATCLRCRSVSMDMKSTGGSVLGAPSAEVAVGHEACPKVAQAALLWTCNLLREISGLELQ